MFKLKFVIIILTLITQFYSTNSCKCLPPDNDMQKAYDKYTHIFKAKVSSIKLSDSEQNYRSDNIISFTDIINFKGKIDLNSQIITSASTASCGVSFNINEDWLVFANLNEQDGSIDVHSCNGNKLAMDAVDEMDRLIQIKHIKKI